MSSPTKMACRRSVSRSASRSSGHMLTPPSTGPKEPRSLEEQRKNNASKHQAIFSLDYGTWQNLVKAYGDRESMIAHRESEQQTQMGARGWYN